MTTSSKAGERGNTLEPGDRFLDAYARTERYLRKAVGAERGIPFGQLVREAAKRDRVIRRFRDDLLEFAELRNAMVHQRVDGRPIAEPHESTAYSLEHIADLLDHPPLLAARFLREPSVARADEPLAAALHRMESTDHSVLPVLQQGTYVGILTSTGVMRWLAHQIDHSAAVAKALVGDVIGYAKQPEERVVWLSERATAFDALDAFQRAVERGHKVDAILLTKAGTRGDPVIGIVTVADVPALLDMMG